MIAEPALIWQKMSSGISGFRQKHVAIGGNRSENLQTATKLSL
jgi:hypothetical protein